MTPDVMRDTAHQLAADHSGRPLHHAERAVTMPRHRRRPLRSLATLRRVWSMAPEHDRNAFLAWLKEGAA